MPYTVPSRFHLHLPSTALPGSRDGNGAALNRATPPVRSRSYQRQRQAASQAESPRRSMLALHRPTLRPANRRGNRLAPHLSHRRALRSQVRESSTSPPSRQCPCRSPPAGRSSGRAAPEPAVRNVSDDRPSPARSAILAQAARAFLYCARASAARLLIARLLKNLIQRRAPHLGREKVAQPDHDQNILFNPSELRRSPRPSPSLRASASACA